MSGEGEVIQYLDDPGGEIRAGVDALLVPCGPVDESPAGRMRALDLATARVLDEMYRVLTGEIPVPPGEYEARLGDLAALLSDLHKRTERASGVAFADTWWKGEA